VRDTPLQSKEVGHGGLKFWGFWLQIPKFGPIFAKGAEFGKDGSRVSPLSIGQKTTNPQIGP